jgi:acetylornithine deacetylase/succinyl-diaminopimelate desuccinylase-like protein
MRQKPGRVDIDHQESQYDEGEPDYNLGAIEPIGHGRRKENRMAHDGLDSYGIPSKRLVDWAQSFVRHPSPQTELFESEPQIQSFIADTVVPLTKELELPFRRDPMGNLIVEIGPQRDDRSLMLMAYAMTHPANRMKSPFAGELIDNDGVRFIRGRGVSEQKGSLAAALGAV